MWTSTPQYDQRCIHQRPDPYSHYHRAWKPQPALVSERNDSAITNHVGATPTTKTGVTRFLVSHSYTFDRFAFFWDGAGDASYTIGTAEQSHPVGKSWAEANGVSWGATTIDTVDATSFVPGALVRNGSATCFVIPDRF
ncbi:hypothetical protein BDP27DRAFT_1318733 [Rhodocollybia butyracea]|uniref:Uncharacterized protein n=1 Tax=Rhodocollybia butyracea TaxID=206335 RepID=A0A9P5Q2A5_9AGAR|nr:hypothetical protein BDP27DRAFT_1318733 [Rhodocollybia butyracea]